ncbi:MAG: SLC13 family permease, partial [bacterium]|nr:SLC13 family permease [bacterium]
MLAQILAVSIFVIMFLLIVMDKIERHIVTLVCGLLTLILVFGIAMHSMNAIWETINIHNIFTPGFWYTAGEASEESSGINWATIFFIAGMMIMVEGMARVGFFRWLCMRIAHMVHYKTIPIFITFMIMSAVLAMFIDSITVILFLAAVTVELAQLLKFNPVPMILSEIFCANLGGSATMCGDPPNIIIGTSLNYS